MPDDRVGKSRMGRAARITGTAAGVAAREATSRMIGAGSSSGRRQAAASRQQLKSAEALVKLFSGMRGAAMKVGQTLSAVDLGMVPEEIRPQFQEILATLQQNADPVPFKAVRKVIEDDLGELSESFADFEEEPIAAASIGQVHRAELHDGRVVAVKVQYPGIAEAIHADMQNLGLGLKLLAVIAPGIDTGEIAAEIRERITDELDYELEAANHREMARIYRGHPFIFVPDVVTSLSRERVLVTEYVEARRFAEIREISSQGERDRIGEILARFYINGPLRHRCLNGDPHPGNSLFLDDGRVAFIDFGFFKHFSDSDVAQLLASTRAVHERDPQALLSVVTELGALPPDPALAQPFFDSYDAIFGWLMAAEPLEADPTKTAEMMSHYTELRRAEGFSGMKLPAEHFVLMRSVFLLIGLLGQLKSTNTWLDIAREWLYGDAPATALGRQEADFFGGRFDYETEAVA